MVETSAEHRKRPLQSCAGRFERDATVVGQLTCRKPVPESQEHSLSVGLIQLQNDVNYRPLHGSLLDEFSGGWNRLVPGGFALALLASGSATVHPSRQPTGHARKPRSKSITRLGLALECRDECLLAEVVSVHSSDKAAS